MTLDVYELEFKVRSEELKKLKKDMQSIFNLSKGKLDMSAAEKSIIKLNKRAEILQKRLNAINKIRQQQNMQSNKLVSWINRGVKGQIGFNRAALSTLFFGMALQKAFGGAMKSIFEGYKKIIPESHQFNVMTTRLSANWEFFKFQLAEALANSPLFQKFIGFLITAVQWLQQMPTWLKETLMWVGLIGAALGTWFLISGTLKLGFAGIIDDLKLINEITGKFQWGALASTGWIALAAAGVAAMAYSMSEFYTNTEIGKKKFDSLKKGMSGMADSIINPIIEGLQSLGFNIKDVQGLIIWFGAIFNNIFVIIAISVNSLIELFRILWNVLSIIIRTTYHAGEAIGSLMLFDFDGAKAAWNSWKKGVVTDLNDIVDAVEKGMKVQRDLQNAWTSKNEINQAVAEYERNIALSAVAEKAGTTNNYIYLDGAVMSTTLTKEQVDGLQALLGAGSVSYSGLTGGN